MSAVHGTVQAPHAGPCTGRSHWYCGCPDCRDFRLRHQRATRHGSGAMLDDGEFIHPIVDEVVVLRLIGGIAVPEATARERHHAVWFLVVGSKLNKEEIAARAGVTRRTVERMILRIARTGYISPLVASTWFVAA